jgi:hypothetical protein
MKTWQLGLVAALCVAVTGCASSDKTGTAADAVQPTPSGMTMGSGMTMANGMTMGPGETMGAADVPSDSARLVCGSEIGTAISKLAALPSTVKGTATWADQLYTCTYQLPAGPLVLSVQDTSDEATGLAYFRSLRTQLRPTRPLRGLEGLGLPAYENADGHVVFLKDGKTLDVDASALTSPVGPQHATPADVAYEVGTDVIGCWSEDD